MQKDAKVLHHMAKDCTTNSTRTCTGNNTNHCTTTTRTACKLDATYLASGQMQGPSKAV
jgi:hypothetical protein